jgi:hypothetical protein
MIIKCINQKNIILTNINMIYNKEYLLNNHKFVLNINITDDVIFTRLKLPKDYPDTNFIKEIKLSSLPLIFCHINYSKNSIHIEEFNNLTFDFKTFLNEEEKRIFKGLGKKILCYVINFCKDLKLFDKNTIVSLVPSSHGIDELKKYYNEKYGFKYEKNNYMKVDLNTFLDKCENKIKLKDSTKKRSTKKRSSKKSKRSTKKRSTKKRSTKKRSTKKRSTKKRSTKKRSTKKRSAKKSKRRSTKKSKRRSTKKRSTKRRSAKKSKRRSMKKSKRRSTKGMVGGTIFLTENTKIVIPFPIRTFALSKKIANEFYDKYGRNAFKHSKVLENIGDLNMVKILIEKGVDINVDDDIALRNSVDKGYLNVVKYLIENGANIHSNDDEALIQSAENGNLEMVEYLVENGANIHAQDDAAMVRGLDNGHKNVFFTLLYAAYQGQDMSSEYHEIPWLLKYINGGYQPEHRLMYNVPPKLEQKCKRSKEPVILYRGIMPNVSWARDEVNYIDVKNNTIILKTNKLTSWTSDEDIAVKFGYLILTRQFQPSEILCDLSDNLSILQKEFLVYPGTYKCEVKYNMLDETLYKEASID